MAAQLTAVQQVKVGNSQLEASVASWLVFDRAMVFRKRFYAPTAVEKLRSKGRNTEKTLNKALQAANCSPPLAQWLNEHVTNRGRKRQEQQCRQGEHCVASDIHYGSARSARYIVSLRALRLPAVCSRACCTLLVCTKNKYESLPCLHWPKFMQAYLRTETSPALAG